MPELPEVETYRRYVEQHALRQKISRVTVQDLRILSGIKPLHLTRALKGGIFTTTVRHGKHLFVRCSRGAWLHLHFGMSGDLCYYDSSEEPPRFARVTIHFSRGTALAYDDMRLFGRVGLSENPAKTIHERRLGFDPLDPALGKRRFLTILKPRRGAVKALLMRQDLVAGLGNLYVDEILFQSGIHPRKPMQTMGDSQLEKIFRSMKRVLRATIDRKQRGLRHPSRFLIPHREEGACCPRCDGSIERIVVAGRTTYFCGTHQK